MNKLFIILLAIALASAHAFVKRDAPAEGTTENYLEAAQKQLQQIAGNLQQAFDPEVIKKNFNDIVDKLSNAAHNFNPKEGKQ